MASPDSKAAGPHFAFRSPVLLWATGSLFMFYPMLLSGFHETVGNAGDPRLVTYLLEHTYRWVGHAPLHTNLWDPPFYWPAKNIFALSEVLLGVAPLYWIWRVVGIGPEGAYQAFLLCASTLTYVFTFALFRRGLKYEPLPAAAAALLFAFGAPRIAELTHAQLIGDFYTPLAILAIIRLFRSDRREPGWSAVLVACCLLQVYSAFYFAWLLDFALLIALALSAVWADGRAAIRHTVALNAPFLLGCGLIAVILALPLAEHYLEASRLVGFRDWTTEVAPRMPLPQNWLFVGPQSVPYFWLTDTSVFRAALWPEGSLGIGLITTALAIAGLVWARRRRPAALIGLTAATMVVLTTRWPLGWNLWRIVYAAVPGAAALRVVSRVGLLLLLALALGFASAIEWLRRRSSAAAILLIGIPLLEQLQFVPSFDAGETARKATEIASRVGPGCKSFYYAALATDAGSRLPYRPWKYQLDAMRAQLRTLVPTLNGYSGWAPPDWRPLYDNVITAASDTGLVRERLERWSTTGRGTCIVTAPAEGVDSEARD